MTRLLTLLLTSLLALAAVSGPTGARERPATERPGLDGMPYPEFQVPAGFRRWRTSTDGKVSAILVVERTTFAVAEGITVRCAVRNNTDAPLTVLRPFGDDYFAHSSGLHVLGPDGPIEYVGPQKDYVLGDGSFLELSPRSVVEEAMTIPKDALPGIDRPGPYVIEYRYLSNGYPKQPPPANFWAGHIDSEAVTVLVR